MTYKRKTIHFLFFKSLNKLLLLSSFISLVLTGIVVLILNSQNKFSNAQDSYLAILTIINVFITSLPLALFILGFVHSILLSIEFNKKNVVINKLCNFESLLKIDTLCLEKNNVLTDGSLEIKKVVPLQALATEQYIAQWLSNLLRATNDSGPIFDALNKKYDFELSAGIVSVLPYNNKNKYSAVSFKGGKTVVLGEINDIPVKNRIGILKRCEEYLNKGCRVVVLGEGKEQIDNSYPGEVEGIALIILKDHIRDGAFDTFKWFKNNGTDIKVISSDDALFTSVLAAEAGLDNSDQYISLEGMELEQIKEVVSKYTVFGKATNEQKELIIKTLKEEGKQVMMIAGESNQLPLTATDFSISTIDSNKADVVLTNTSLYSVSTIINSGRNFVNALQKAASLALAKTFYVFAAILLFTIFSNSLNQCLFALNHLLLFDLIVNGVACYFLMLDNKGETNNSFFQNVFKQALPLVILQILGLLSAFSIYALENNQLLVAGVYSIDVVLVISIYLFIAFSFASLYIVFSPLSKWKAIIVALTIFTSVLILVIANSIAYANKEAMTPYLEMSGPAYLLVSIITVIYSSLYLFIAHIVRIIKGDNFENEN